MNYVRFVNEVSSRRTLSPLRVQATLRNVPGMIFLSGGLPSSETLPFVTAQFTLRNGETINIDEENMKVSLQYGTDTGLKALLDWIRVLQVHEHNPPTAKTPRDQGGMDILITVGSQDALLKSFEMCVSPGDKVLVGCPEYCGALSCLRPLNCTLLAVDTDEDGMIPSSLRHLMSEWTPEDAKNAASDIPKLLYTTPNGVNPTGASLTLERKKEIYQIAQEYDLLILEDDPYFYMQFHEKIPSFLSLDIDGRVLRFDSFSKIISSGLRVGYVSGPAFLVTKIQNHMECGSFHTSMLGQVLINELLHKWGLQTFLKYADENAKYYEKKRDIALKSLEKHLTGLAKWTVPKAGMFIWIKLISIKDTKTLIEEKAISKKVAFVPGYVFSPSGDRCNSYVRACYSYASAEDIDKGFERLVSLLKEEQEKS